MVDELLKRVRGYWYRLLSLDCQQSIWVESEELGKIRVIKHRRKRYHVRIPEEFDRKVVVRLKGIGKARGNKKGDLYLHVWLNKGQDVRRSLWLPETLASEGGKKELVLNGRRINMVIPANSHSGLVVRLRGLGREARIPIRDPLLKLHRGDMLVKLFFYPKTISPNYGGIVNLSTEVLAQEGWIYRALDEVIDKMGMASFSTQNLQAGEIAEQFNESGWRGIFRTLESHLNLKHLNITVDTSSTIVQPGNCTHYVWRQNDTATRHYLISINSQYIDNPFSVAAILAHELCHVVYTERIDDGTDTDKTFEHNQATWDAERTVDLLVCMFRLGEFRLRFARDNRISLGYFNLVSFERMQVIVSRKLDSI